MRPVRRPEGGDLPAKRLTDLLEHEQNRAVGGLGFGEDPGDGVLELRALLGSAALPDLLDDRAHTERLAVGGEHRVVAREPTALGFGRCRHAHRHLERDNGLARLEHAACDRLDHVRELWNHLGQRVADVLLDRTIVDARQRIVDATYRRSRSQKPSPTGALP